jgi:hypothetical protein
VIYADIVDQTRYNKMYNKAGVVYENTTLGKFQFYLDDFRSNIITTKSLLETDNNSCHFK